MSPLLLAYTLFFAQDAHALSCEHGVTKLNIAHHAMDVPRNVIPSIWYNGSSYEREPVLLRIAGTQEEIDVTVVETHINGLVQLHPSELLLANVTYELYRPQYMDNLRSFTTSEEIDISPTDPPEIIDATRNDGFDMWGSWKWIIVEVAPVSEPVFFAVEVSKTEDFAESEITYVDDQDWEFPLGKGQCAATIETPAKDVKWIKVRAIDRAGNISETLAPYQKGCNTTTNPISFLLGLLAAPIFAFRRRRDV